MTRKVPVPPPSFFILLGVGGFLAYKIHDVLIPFLLGFALAYLLNPVVHYFEVRGLKRQHIVLTIYVLVAVALSIAANSLLPAMTSELALLHGKAPGYVTKTQALVASLQHDLAQRLPIGQSMIEAMSLKIYEPLVKQIPKIPAYVLGLFPLFSLLFLVPFITFFLLLDSKKLLQTLIQSLPSRYVEQALHLASEIDSALGNYIRGILIVALAVGTASYVGLKCLKVDYALAIATLCGIASFIPYFGAVLGMAVGGLVAFFQYKSAWVAGQVVLLFLGIRLADEAFIQPFVSIHAVHLHPMIFLLALMAGGKLFGFVGLLFAVPTACVIKSLILVAYDWYATETQTAPRDTLPQARLPYI